MMHIDCKLRFAVMKMSNSFRIESLGYFCNKKCIWLLIKPLDWSILVRTQYKLKKRLEVSQFIVKRRFAVMKMSNSIRIETLEYFCNIKCIWLLIKHLDWLNNLQILFHLLSRYVTKKQISSKFLEEKKNKGEKLVRIQQN